MNRTRDQAPPIAATRSMLAAVIAPFGSSTPPSVRDLRGQLRFRLALIQPDREIVQDRLTGATRAREVWPRGARRRRLYLRLHFAVAVAIVVPLYAFIALITDPQGFAITLAATAVLGLAWAAFRLVT